MSDPTVEEFLAGYSPEVRQMALALRELVLTMVPTAVERVNAGHKVITYGAGSRMGEQICYIAPLTSSVNLGFHRGTELPDPHALLTGTGKRLRHVKVRRRDEVDRPALQALLHSAALGAAVQAPG